MSVRCQYFLAALTGLWMAFPLLGQQPAQLEVERGPAATPRLEPSANQKLADMVAEHLRQSGQLHHYNLEIVFHDGAAELTGTVADQPQREEVLRLVQGVPGVERVVDHLNLGGAITRAGAMASMQETAPMPRTSEEGPGTGPVTEPVPMYQASQPSPYELNPPRMPPYAWPTYAPYNNYSRVAYPEAYPYQSWPFIGPPYPFPKVPLGWRKIKLEWEDGHWWYSKVGSPHDWWRLRYW